MGRMIFDLPDEDRERLEAVRRHRGHRSQAETLRELIRQAAASGLPTPQVQAEIKRRAAEARATGSRIKDGDASSIEGVDGVMVAKTVRAAVGEPVTIRLPVGHAAEKPGSRLKRR